MKVVWIAAVSATLLGCGAGEDAIDRGIGVKSDSRIWEVQQTLADGRKVTCLKVGVWDKGGLSCDWLNASVK